MIDVGTSRGEWRVALACRVNMHSVPAGSQALCLYADQQAARPLCQGGATDPSSRTIDQGRLAEIAHVRAAGRVGIVIGGDADTAGEDGGQGQEGEGGQSGGAHGWGPCPGGAKGLGVALPQQPLDARNTFADHVPIPAI